jgi:NADH-quinone oxidoreductase subunit J
MEIHNILFYLFASIALVSSIMVIVSNNPIHSVVSLILVFTNVTGLLILLKIEFIAMMFIIIYVGAIAVLFLFVVMMLNIKLNELSENLVRYLPVGALISIIFFLEIFLILYSHFVPFTSSTLEDSVLSSLNLSSDLSELVHYNNIIVDSYESDNKN